MAEKQVDTEYMSLHGYQEYTFRHRSACRAPAKSGQEYLTTRKDYIEPCKTWQDEGTGGETSVSRTGPALSRQGN